MKARAILVPVYDLETRRHALALLSDGRSLNSVSRHTGISRSAIREWTVRIEPLPRRSGTSCGLCAETPSPPAPAAEYVYLLGLYLGDGCISAHRRGVQCLRIACDNRWPGLIDAAAGAVQAVWPGNRVCRVRAPGCTYVKVYSKHLVCHFPQHGPGRKHHRRIGLEPWQQDMADSHPWELVRGLFHSDGCRTTNRIVRHLADGSRHYEYPRYFFTNASEDIMRLCTATLDRLGVAWKRTGARNISVARRESVALMDLHVGAKY